MSHAKKLVAKYGDTFISFRFFVLGLIALAVGIGSFALNQLAAEGHMANLEPNSIVVLYSAYVAIVVGPLTLVAAFFAFREFRYEFHYSLPSTKARLASQAAANKEFHEKMTKLFPEEYK